MTLEQIWEYFERPFLGAPAWSWIIFLLAWIILFLVAAAVMKFLRSRVKKKAEKQEEKEKTEEGKTEEEAKLNAWQILYAVLQKNYRLFLLGISLLAALLLIPGTQPQFESVMKRVALVMLILQVGIWIMGYLDGGLQRLLLVFNIRETAAQTAMGVLKFFVLIVIWAAILLLILANVGIEIGPLIAGLGIGGIAIAFALQKILEDVFCSVAIVLDRPFEVGDFIIMGEVLGTIERIGIKTTRVRSLGGEQIIVSNADLTSSRIRNYKRMPQRRVVFSFGILYQTPAEKAEVVGGWVKDIIQGIELTRFDRAHLKEFGDSSYNYEVVYYVDVPDYAVYMDVQQKINIGMIRKFKEEGVEFAYPTRTLFLEDMPPVKVVGTNSGSSYGGEKPQQVTQERGDNSE